MTKFKSVFQAPDTSPASATTAVGTTLPGFGDFDSFLCLATLQGATGGTLDVYLQISPDGGTTWIDFVHFAQLAASAAQVNKTFSVTRSVQQLALQSVGTGISPALAANTVLGGNFGDRIRTLYVAGVGTSAGATQTVTFYAAT